MGAGRGLSSCVLRVTAVTLSGNGSQNRAATVASSVLSFVSFRNLFSQYKEVLPTIARHLFIDSDKDVLAGRLTSF